VPTVTVTPAILAPVGVGGTFSSLAF